MRAGTWLTALCVLCLPCPGQAARAATDSLQVSTHTAPERSPLLLSMTIGREHDDNVLQLTRQNLDRFTNRPGPPRFLIAKVGDMATTAQGAVRWRGHLLKHLETRLALDAELYLYDHDRVCDRQQYGLSAVQELTPSRRQPLTIEMYGGRIPDYYLGEITDLNESVAAQTTVRRSLSFAQTGYGLRLRQELLRGRLAFEDGLEFVHRAYNVHFPERTNDNRQLRLQFEATPFRGWDATARVTWLQGDLNARGDLPDTLGVLDTDISYDHEGIGAVLALPWGRASWRGRLDASFTPELRHYKTSDKFDILRFGRENHRRDTWLRVTQRVLGLLDVIVTWQRLISRAEFHEGITFPPEQTNFDQEQFGVELRTRWELAIR